MLTLILLTLVAFSSVIGQYANEETLDGQGRYILRWNLLPESESIEFEVEADTTGFVGFGISPSGTMTGADIFIGGVHSNGTIYGEVKSLQPIIMLPYINVCRVGILKYKFVCPAFPGSTRYRIYNANARRPARLESNKCPRNVGK